MLVMSLHGSSSGSPQLSLEKHCTDVYTTTLVPSLEKLPVSNPKPYKQFFYPTLSMKSMTLGNRIEDPARRAWLTGL